MKNINEAILDLIDNIDGGNHLEANNIFTDLLQSKIDELLDTKKMEVSLDMFNTESCADCDEELEEGLKGNQHKIDANKNGKIDAMDFKMLRKKKNMKVEQNIFTGHKSIKHANLETPETQKRRDDTVKKGQAERKAVIKKLNAKGAKIGFKEAYADPYAAKKAVEMKKKQDELMTSAKKEYEASKESQGKLGKNFMKMKKEEVAQVDEDTFEQGGKMKTDTKPRHVSPHFKHLKKLSPAEFKADVLKRAGLTDVSKKSPAVKKEEVEQMDELSNKTLSSYVDKASASRREADKKSTEKYMSRSGRATSMKRSAGISNAYRAMKKEEVEQMDELSNKTMKSYMKKATTSERHASNVAKKLISKGGQKKFTVHKND